MGSPGNKDNNLKICFCLGLKVVLPDGTVLSVKPVKSMVKIEKATNGWVEMIKHCKWFGVKS